MTNFKLLRISPILLLLTLLCQCGAPQPPQAVRVPMASRAPAATLVGTARTNWDILADPSRRADWDAARTNYNSAIGKLFDQLRVGPGDWNSRAATLGTAISTHSDHSVALDKLDAVFPASQVKNQSVGVRRTTDGVGLALVGWKKTGAVGAKRAPYLLPNGLPYNISATLVFDRSSAPVWHFNKRWTQEKIQIGNTSHPLAADWTAPNSFYWQMCDLDDLKIQNVILPERYMQESGIYFVTPYDPEKIPVVFVHGLVSSPDAFKNMINELAPEPWFRERYQIWLYNYPTGNPWIFSSMNFRKLMGEACAYARTKGHDRNLNRMVVVSHSMGGLITRSSVTNPQNVLFDAHFRKPIDQLKFSPRTIKLIRDATLYQPLSEPERVIFLAVPHRGSPMANLKISTWISKLIRLPKTLTIDLLDNTLNAVGDVIQGEDPEVQFPTSINSLSPRNLSTVALNKLPLPGRITFHSIIGDRGKCNTPDSSDGVVPYWSSHVSPVASEKIVPCNHSVPDSPEAAEELKRILKLHLSESN